MKEVRKLEMYLHIQEWDQTFLVCYSDGKVLFGFKVIPSWQKILLTSENIYRI